jgi:conjugal transfer/entry exclusion protein
MAVQPSSLPNFSQDVQTYLQLEDQIQELQNQLKSLRETKQTTQQKRTFALGGKSVSFVERKQYSTLSFTYLAEKLPKIIPDQNQVDYVIQYLKEQREVKTIPDLKCTIQNK